MNKKAKIEVAVESKLIEYDIELRKVLSGEIMSGGSSRIHANEIVDLVLRMNNGEEIEVRKPFEYFKVGDVMSEYKWRRIFKRWAPKDILNGDVIRIMGDYGYDNDSLLPEKTAENTRQYSIEIIVKEIKDDEQEVS